jgi:predicted O-methyltransferase YrrM
VNKEQVQTYLRNLFVDELPGQRKIAERLAEHGLPLISVPGEIGKLLYLLVKMSGAKRVLEIGALAGYSTTWLARALPENGKVLSIELKEEHVQLAAQAVKECGLDGKVSFLTGDAKIHLQNLIDQNEQFDFFFIDADKPNYLTYLEAALELAIPGALVVADNLLLGGRIFCEEDQNPSAVSIRKVNRFLAEEPRLESLIIPIGDGLGIARVLKRD